MRSERYLVDHLADHVAIRSLMDRYADGLNRRHWGALERT